VILLDLAVHGPGRGCHAALSSGANLRACRCTR
jgi:hypothetical protein